MKILILYDKNSTFATAIAEHLSAFRLYSRHEIFYLNAVAVPQFLTNLDAFDLVVLHYSVRLSLADYLSESIASQLIQTRTPKVLFIQDEYDSTEVARDWMDRLKFDIVFTCVPESYVESVYPKARFPLTTFIQNLTGYVPDRLLGGPRTPLHARTIDVGYRGRSLHPVYGRLGWEKEYIGTEFKKRACAANLKIDIETDDSKRIYGEAWFKFLSSCRTFLGTESGSNIFDLSGELRQAVNQALALHPAQSFLEIERTILTGHEGTIAKTNQVSPKMFEAISLGTPLILFEGTYSQILKPNVHFIELKKDFSNFEEVVARVNDVAFLETIATKAFDDIVNSGKYSYSKFIAGLDDLFEKSFDRKSSRNVDLLKPCAYSRFNTIYLLDPTLLPLKQFLPAQAFDAAIEAAERVRLHQESCREEPLTDQDVALVLRDVSMRRILPILSRVLLDKLRKRRPPEMT